MAQSRYLKKSKSKRTGLQGFVDEIRESQDEVKSLEKIHAMEKKLHNREQRIRDLEGKLKTAYKELKAQEAKVDTVIGASDYKAPKPIKRRRKNKGEATAVGVLSDLHVGEHVNPDSVSGLNEFNVKICEQRLQNVIDRYVEEVRLNRSVVNVDSLILALLGDLMNNYLHDEAQEDNTMSPMEEMLFLMENLPACIDYILEELSPRRLVIPCCHGNHGRLCKRPKYSTSAKNNYEWAMYMLLEKHYRDVKEVEVDVAPGRVHYSQVYDRTYRWHHGDDIAYYGGVGGLTTPASKAIAKWDYEMKADLTVIGHYHQLLMLDHLVVNGSLVGYNAYARKIKASPERAQQAFWIEHSKHGMVRTAALIA